MKKYTWIMLSVTMLFFFRKAVAQDWANLNRYKQENLELEASQPDQKRVVFMGNSITEFWKENRPEFFSKNAFIDRGISGQTTPQMLLRFRQDVIDLKPVAVVILAGINDIAENTGPTTIDEIFGNIVSMCELAKANQIQVFLCSVLPAADFYWRPGLEPAPKVVALNAKLLQYAKENNLSWVDYYSAMNDGKGGLKKEFGDDGVHPNKAGYAMMEKILLEKMNQRTVQ